MPRKHAKRSYITGPAVIAASDQPAVITGIRLRKSVERILLETETQIVRPGGTVNWYVSGPAGRVSIQLERLPNSGGHHHGGGPTGAANPPQFTLGPNYPQNFRVVYRAPLASGMVRITSTFSNGETDVDYNQVMVDGLLQLNAGPSIVLVGATSTHPDNHYGGSVLVASLSALGDDFRAKFAKPIYVNDMSLQWGGLFDYTTHWAPPHRRHTEGRNSDVRSIGMSDTEREFFRQKAIDRGFTVVLENEGVGNEHWHLTI